MSIKAVVFDLDGTLYDRKGLPRKLILRSLLHLRTLGAERTVRRVIAGTAYESEEAFYDDFFRRIAAAANSDREKVSNWYNNIYLPLMTSILKKDYTIRPWVREVFTALRSKGIRTAVFSDYGFVREKLQAVDFDPEWADMVFDVPSLGGLKPCKECFDKVAAMLGLDNSEILIVGDRDDTDGEGARRAGMPFQLVGPETGASDILGRL